MFKVGKVEIDKAILLAPMEDVTDISFRLVCRELGADVVYTEFVNSEGLVRSNLKTHNKKILLYRLYRVNYHCNISLIKLLK